uniref:Uncharacterized protein n=1 Tax=Aegilops tauschii subsp. strangulata TaxID=200361 RepID=A0A453GD21_AEGTS
MYKELFTSFALLPLDCRCWRNKIAMPALVRAAGTPEGLEQPCDVHAFGSSKALWLMPHSSPVTERVVFVRCSKGTRGKFNKRAVG